MTRFVAFLRAINVGGHTVTMAALRTEFEALGMHEVDTFIASGNVIFRSPSRDGVAVARKIEARLSTALGYDVATFVRTADEVDAIARYQPFPPANMRAAASLNVGLLTAPLPAASRSALAAMTTPIDTFHVNGREIYWMCRKKQSESSISNVVIERALKLRSTFRGMNTMTRLAGKLAVSADERS